MLPDINQQIDIQKAEPSVTGTTMIKSNLDILTPEENIINEVNNYIKLKQICEQFPDHCIQLCFLS